MTQTKTERKYRYCSYYRYRWYF